MQEQDIQSKAVQETERLQEARRKYADLKKEEEKYLADREARAEKRISNIIKETNGAISLFESVVETIEKSQKNLSNLFKKADSLFSSLFDKAQSYVERSQNLHARCEKILQTLVQVQKTLEKTIEKNSRWQKELKEKEQEIVKREKEAEKQMQEAMRIADWAKTGKRYTINKRKP